MEVFLQLLDAMNGFSHLIKDISIFYSKDVQNEKKVVFTKNLLISKNEGASVTIFSTRKGDLI